MTTESTSQDQQQTKTEEAKESQASDKMYDKDQKESKSEDDSDSKENKDGDSEDSEDSSSDDSKEGESKESSDDDDSDSSDESDSKKKKDDESDEGDKSDDEKPKEITKESLKVPEGSKVSEAKVDEIVQYAKEQGLSQQQAQAQLEREIKLSSNFRKDAEEQLNEQVESWTDESKKDKEFGGEKLKETQVRCNSLLKKYFDETFVKQLIEVGYSNHPGLIRGLNRIAQTMDPDQLVISSQTNSSKPEKEASEVLYDKK